MMSMFSSFDMNFSNFYFFFTMILTLNIFSKLYKMDSFNYFKQTLSMELSKFFYSLMPKNLKKFNNFFILAVFMSVFFINFSSVLPFNFPLTSQVSAVMFFSLSMWIALMMNTFMLNIKGFMSHCIPEGSPIMLSFFLYLIEILSNMIRPLTVTVRLVANILAGHLLMNLLSIMVFEYKIMTLMYMGLNLVELFVALIQAYIYATMMTLYLAENN